MNEKCCPVFSDAEPVSRYFLRTIPDLHNIMALVRAGCKLFQCEFDANSVVHLEGEQVFLCPSGKYDLVQAITVSGP